MARGQGGSLFLPCTTLAFATPCRFIPALSDRINMRRTININRGSRATALTWLGARVVRYSFPVRLLHSLLHAGLSRRYPDQGSAPRILQHYRDWEKYAALR